MAEESSRKKRKRKRKELTPIVSIPSPIGQLTLGQDCVKSSSPKSLLSPRSGYENVVGEQTRKCSSSTTEAIPLSPPNLQPERESQNRSSSSSTEPSLSKWLEYTSELFRVDDPQREVCFRWRKGCCVRGNSCRFRHSVNKAIPEKRHEKTQNNRRSPGGRHRHKSVTAPNENPAVALEI